MIQTSIKSFTPFKPSTHSGHKHHNIKMHACSLKVTILRKALGTRFLTTKTLLTTILDTRSDSEQDIKQNTIIKDEHMHLFHAMLQLFEHYLPSDFIFVAFQVFPRSNFFPRGNKSFL